jgi:glycosyltransferase involved in cell wall biosynthesis
VGEPLPTDEAGDRLHRVGILANLLVEKGHQVLWWTSTFDHVRKKQRFDIDTSIDINNCFRINLLHSLEYKKNVSLRRIINHYGIARKFAILAEPEQKPDIILCSLPTLELSLVATEYGRKKGIPVVLDVRDLWPDIFLELVPEWGRWFVRTLLSPMFKTVSAACTGANAIIGITPAFVDWGVKYANRTRSGLDRDFPLGYSQDIPAQEAVIEAENFWWKFGVTKNNNDFIACFFGTMGRQFEMETIIEAARKLKFMKPLIRFILCGSGDNLDYYKKLAGDCDNIIFPGWVGAVEIWTLMRMSSVGLAPYRSSKDFMASIPNKSIEYLSAGLPILSSLKGTLKELLSTNDCGITYDNGDAEDLVSILVNLYDHPEIIRKMSENAYVLYKEKFIAEKVYNNMISHLELVRENYRN